MWQNLSKVRFSSQQTAALKRRLEIIGLPNRREKLCAGDYSVECTTDNGVFTLADKVCIERKMSADELATCYGTERDRFEREFERAKQAHIRLYLLCESATYENIYNHKYRSRLAQAAYTASLFAWMARYDCHVIFYKAETAPKIIHDVLYRELKERLERGDAD